MKIATWNVNSVKARLEVALDALKELRADVVLLQELKCEDLAFPAEPFEDMGYNVCTHGQKTYNGVAILSKYPLEDIRRGLPGFEDPQARYVEAFTGGLRVASVYVPNGQALDSEKFPYKMAFLEALFAHTQHLLSYEEPCVVGGDFNIAPFEADTYNQAYIQENHIHCSEKERAALRRFFYHSYTDALRAANPDVKDLYTWWDYRAASFQNNHGLRIDHLLLSPQATDKMLAAHVQIAPRAADKPSDHTPVWVDLEMAA